MSTEFFMFPHRVLSQPSPDHYCSGLMICILPSFPQKSSSFLLRTNHLLCISCRNHRRLYTALMIRNSASYVPSFPQLEKSTPSLHWTNDLLCIYDDMIYHLCHNYNHHRYDLFANLCSTICMHYINIIINLSDFVQTENCCFESYSVTSGLRFTVHCCLFIQISALQLEIQNVKNTKKSKY